MKVAIAHDYLTQFGGAERVVLSLMKAFPEAPIYTTLYDPDTTFPEFRSADVRVSPLNKAGAMRGNHRMALPFLAPASSRITIDADVVIASSSGWAHGFRTNGRKLVYCHSPARWLYLTDEYFGSHGASSVIRPALAALRPVLKRWDAQAAASADRYLANSHVVQERIKHVYGIDSDVVFPPHRVDLDGSRELVPQIADDWPDFHLLVSRLLPYKNVDRAIEAFNDLPDERLVVVGKGPLAAQLRSKAKANSILLEGIPDAQLRWLYANATALIAPSHEDFGLTVVEAAAFGTPALALRAGGYLDTVEPGLSGYFFSHPKAADIADAVHRHRERPLDRDAVAEHARGFDEDAFVGRIRNEVDLLMAGAFADRKHPHPA